VLGLDHRQHLADADHRAQGVFDQLRRARGDAGQAQVDAELAAVACFARGMHARGDRAKLGDGLDQARQQARIGGGGDEEEGADGIGRGKELVITSSNWRVPLILLSSHPPTPGAT